MTSASERAIRSIPLFVTLDTMSRDLFRARSFLQETERTPTREMICPSDNAQSDEPRFARE